MPAGGSSLESLVFQLSLILLYPVLALLSISFLRLLWHLGEEIDRMLRMRSRDEAALRQLRDLRAVDGRFGQSLAAIAANERQPIAVRRFARGLANELEVGPAETIESRIDHLLRQAEAELTRSVNQLRVLVRLGPCLGLAGTLIPLGPGLLALSGGDLTTLSNQLVVSFSTTVVGLVVGGGAYVLGTMRAHTADLVGSDLELISNIVAAGVPARTSEGATV